MVASPLPDRDRRHLLQFYLAPRLDYGMRLFWAALLILVGLGIQLFSPFSSPVLTIVLSLPLLLAGTTFLLVRGYNLRPQQPLYQGNWEKTTRDRFARLRELEDEVKSWDESFTDLTCVSGVVALAAMAIGLLVLWIILDRSSGTRPWAAVLVLDAAVLLLPHWITGTRRGWRPVALRQQVDSLEIALGAIEKFKEPACQIQPMFEMAGKGESQVPINARVFVRFPDGPSQFLGMQLQVALNNVQGTSYPYLYAVIVAQRPFRLLDRFLPAIRQQLQDSKPAGDGILAALQRLKQSALTVESSTENDVEVIVIRQQTSKTSGYHTDPAMVRHIAQSAWQGVTYVLTHAADSAHAADSEK